VVDDTLTGETDALGNIRTGNEMHVTWQNAADPGDPSRPREVGFYRVQMQVSYPGQVGEIGTPIDDADSGQGSALGWQCPQRGLAIHDLVWKHRPILHVHSLEVGLPNNINEFVRESMLKQWTAGVQVPVVPFPVLPPTSTDFFFDLFKDSHVSGGSLNDYSPEDYAVLSTDAEAVTMYHSTSGGRVGEGVETADFVFIQFFMFENFSTISHTPIPTLTYPTVYHEGDLEYVQMVLRIKEPSAPGLKSWWLGPMAATASQHLWAQTLLWSRYDGSPCSEAHMQTHVEHEMNGRFGVYVALGSHATFFASDPKVCTANVFDAVGGGIYLGNSRVLQADCNLVPAGPFPTGEYYDSTSPLRDGEVEYLLKPLEQEQWLDEFGGRWGFFEIDDPWALTNGPAGPPTRAALREAEDPDPVVLLEQPCRLHNLGILRSLEEGVRIDDCRSD
jgi:hypothetical protein